MQTPRQKLDALVDLFVPDLRSAFLASIQDVVDNVLINQLVDKIEQGDVIGAFQALGYSDAAMRPLVAAIERAFEQGGVLTGQTFPKYLNTSSGKAVFRFDVRNSVAEKWLRDQSSSLVTSIGEDIRVAVRNVLEDGMRAGINPRSIALDLVGRLDPKTRQRYGGIIGLTPGQQRWVDATRRDLQNLNSNYFSRELRDKRYDAMVSKAIAKGEPLDAETVNRLVDRYKANALRYRGETIARTEAINSLNQSEYMAVTQAIAMGGTQESAVRRIWDAVGDDRTRETHMAMNGQSVGLKQPFVSPSGAMLMHPGDSSLGAPGSEVINCRCRVRLKVDWLADLD